VEGTQGGREGGSEGGRKEGKGGRKAREGEGVPNSDSRLITEPGTRPGKVAPSNSRVALIAGMQ